MNVGIYIFRAVVLHDPVNLRKIDTSRGNICTEEHSRFSLNEFEINSGTLRLFLSTVQLKKLYAQLQPLESLIGETNFFAGREEHNALRLLVALQETKKGI